MTIETTLGEIEALLKKAQDELMTLRVESSSGARREPYNDRVVCKNFGGHFEPERYACGHVVKVRAGRVLTHGECPACLEKGE